LRGLIIEETGQGEDSPVVSMTLNTIKGIKKFANFKQTDTAEKLDAPETSAPPPALPMSLSNSQNSQIKSLGLNLGYTINLNLPATSDISVFNAIF
jgi:hypothetical protein